MNTATMTDATNHQATTEDVRLMIGERNYQTAWCLLRDHLGLGTVTMDEVQPWQVEGEAVELFDLLDAVDIEALTQQGEDTLQDALHHYNHGDEEAAYEALDDSLAALAMVQRWDMTYCEYFEWLDAACQG